MKNPMKYIKENGDGVELKGAESGDKGGTMEDETSNPEPVWERLKLAQGAYPKLVDMSHGRSGPLAHSGVATTAFSIG